jgi:hypothetical protein
MTDGQSLRPAACSFGTSSRSSSGGIFLRALTPKSASRATFFEPAEGEPHHPKQVDREWVYPKKDSGRTNFKEIVDYLYYDNPMPASRPPYIIVKANIDMP